ncbi:MAG: DUF5320 domain-containing protein [Deltaproteobacteria bacterium]|nr:DUF5320 domain-containing protein [Deltaproteobacteria bacterium]MBW1985705.1 DUF5320 domain-containing protein [Deltaproteobacteria bacterium]MBW2134619.1 DUF5320 domain-containing protein [Deltaproteobacteria bacterium]
MPRFDGTGPRGQGPGTGRGRGYCRTRYEGRGRFGPGRGAGSGRGLVCRFQGRGYGALAWDPTPAGYLPGRGAYPTRQPELAELQTQEQMLTQELRALRDRIAALESSTG